MNKILFATAVTLACQCGNASAEDVDQLSLEGRKIVKSFFVELKGELGKAMKAGGPVNAVQVCRIKAPAISMDVGEKTGWRVARTSLKLRNPGNTPDAWERKVLESFEARQAGGEDVKKMEHVEIVAVDGQRTFRYMKAIPTAELCVNCHGSEVKPEVEARLKELYPADRARGFKVGDIRGAFTLSKPM